MYLILRILCLIFFISGVNRSLATHIKGGEIIVERLSQFSLTYKITVIGYRDTGSSILFGGGTLRFGDGTETKGPFSETTAMPIGDNQEQQTFSITHTFPQPNGSGYLISYEEEYRTEGILNMKNSAGAQFYIEALLIIDPFFGNNSLPVFQSPPVALAEIGSVYLDSLDVYDPDGDSLVYHLVIPKKSKTELVEDYRFPNECYFYSYAHKSSSIGNYPILSLDSTGILRWDWPGDFDDYGHHREYTLAIKVEDWRKVQGVWYRMGYVTRDYQIEVTGEVDSGGNGEYPCQTLLDAGKPLDFSFKTYPNPFRGSFQIESKESIHYAIYTLTGELVQEGFQIHGSKQTIHFDKPKGIYILQTSSETGNRSSLRIVKSD